MRHLIDRSGIACGIASDPTLELVTNPSQVDCPRCGDALALGLPQPGAGIRVYVATGVQNASLALWYGKKLVAMGCEWTYDWTERAMARRPDEDVSVEELREIGEAEVDAVCRADVVLVLLPGGAGTHTELGVAIALGKRVVLLPESGDPTLIAPCPFYRHPAVQVVAREEVFSAVVAARRGPGGARHVYIPETLSSVEIENPAGNLDPVYVHALGAVSPIPPNAHVVLSVDLDATARRIQAMHARTFSRSSS